MSSSAAGGTNRFGSVLSHAARARGLDWSRLCADLADRGHRLDGAVLRAWAAGDDVPRSALERTAIPALELLLGEPIGTLGQLVPPRSTGSHNEPLKPLDDDEALYADLRRRLDRARADVTIISIDDALVLGSDRQLVGHRVRELVRAETDGADGRLIWLQCEGPAGTPYVLPERNCRLGRVVDVPERAVLACDLRFGHELPRGESWNYEYSFGHVGPPEPATYWERTCHGTLRELHIEVRFHPETLPARIETYVESGGEAQVEAAALSGHAVSMLLFDVGPGVVGVRWAW